MSVRETRLENGLTVLSHHMPTVETVSLGVWVHAGARNERPEENGIAHFLEHMAFKGTSHRSARQIAEEIEAAGGDMNAATGMETTAYYARMLKEDLALGVDILADILLNPRLDREEMEREREVILEEIAAAHDMPDDLVFDLAHDAAFPNQPLGRPILGTVEHVSGFTPDDIATYRRECYSPDRMVVAAAGSVDHDRLAALAGEAFSGLKAFPVERVRDARFEGGARLVPKPLGQAHIVLAFPSPGYLDEEVYALQVLAGAVGGGMSSRLFQEVRERRGLCYSISSFAETFADTGLFCVYAATGARRVNDLVSVTADEMLAAAETMDEEEVARARAQLKASLVLCLESSSARADQIARQKLVFGRVPEIEEVIAKVEAVDIEAVRSLARRIFRGNRLTLAAVGALDNLAPYDEIAEKFA
ncbi:insulinase family protein [Kaustia mangrovi]|uniref:Insulinase family protein n=1 Tax=Kaustia mangrovi TaxID=2593653 RepID=A0A7S8C2G7_9HYPH|nr:pitrilysin family protein [Kaustia mangrovi]QPC42131.1 insulinase family protein [Kaustia mangrovi]